MLRRRIVIVPLLQGGSGRRRLQQLLKRRKEVKNHLLVPLPPQDAQSRDTRAISIDWGPISCVSSSTYPETFHISSFCCVHDDDDDDAWRRGHNLRG